MSTERLSIGIVGGSLGGLFAAALLSKSGHDVTVYERSAHGLDGRGAGLVPQQEIFDILAELGEDQAAAIGVVARERIFLDQTGRIVERNPTPQTQISWDLLYRTVRSLVSADRYRSGIHVTGVQQTNQGMDLLLADGSHKPFDLVIGADGIGSTVRAGIPGAGEPVYAGYVAWRALIPEADMPSESAMLLDRFTFYNVRGAQVLGYLIPGADGATAIGRRRYNCVWYRRASKNDGELARTLTDRVGKQHEYSLSPSFVPEKAVAGLVGDAERFLPTPFAAIWRTVEDPFVQAIFDYATPNMVFGRLALLGDAAFVARPHTAMGVSKAAGDAMALHRLLARTDTLPSALASYAQERERFGRVIAAHGMRLGSSLS
jgi:2-polyprenyl-6-methoxyphenol hydroxylase-like FAD-dependent oxidoreductase